MDLLNRLVLLQWPTLGQASHQIFKSKRLKIITFTFRPNVSFLSPNEHHSHHRAENKEWKELSWKDVATWMGSCQFRSVGNTQVLPCSCYGRSLPYSCFYFFSHNLYCFVFISVYVMLLLAVLVTIGPSAFNKFGFFVWKCNVKGL